MRIKTIAAEGRAEFTEKKSRFIGQAFPVEHEDAAAAYLDAVKREHPKLVGHIPYAWLIGGRSRHNDAGEPGGTAGMPILNVIIKEGLTNIVIAVVRYYGGIHLGAGGLVRAYGAAAKAAIRDAGIVEQAVYNTFTVSCPYTLQGKFQHEFTKRGYAVADIGYTDCVVFTVLTEESPAAFETLAADISSGTARVQV